MADIIELRPGYTRRKLSELERSLIYSQVAMALVGLYQYQALLHALEILRRPISHEQ